MSLSDFMTHFTAISIAHLPPDRVTNAVASSLNQSIWHVKEFVGNRESIVPAGKQRRYSIKENKRLVRSKKHTAWYNPQIELRVPDASQPVFVLISLMETNSVALLEKKTVEP